MSAMTDEQINRRIAKWAGAVGKPNYCEDIRPWFWTLHALIEERGLATRWSCELETLVLLDERNTHHRHWHLATATPRQRALALIEAIKEDQ